MVKYNKAVSSSRRKNRKAHFSAHSTAKRKLMSAPLSKELQIKHGIRHIPIRKDDEVQIVRGTIKNVGGSSKVIAVYRRKWVIHIEKVTKDRANSQTVQVGIHPSNVKITKLKMDRNRKAMIARAKGEAGNKGKFTADDVQTNADNVD